MPGVAKPTQRAHVDYTLDSGPNRLKAFVSLEEAERLQKTPYAIVQVSKAILQPCTLLHKWLHRSWSMQQQDPSVKETF